ncbi:hypothetical protein DPMN_007045 [Dreissena polymorpha]|uniref:Uncharacterized protein n=1 Tax=Dreissena polymorpha TaxID=45954 RepID=A0A9D4RXY3_DREPO|nr:hypothetical protein DPMN_007045 [Dreissena polymorpha]
MKEIMVHKEKLNIKVNIKIYTSADITIDGEKNEYVSSLKYMGARMVPVLMWSKYELQ